MYMCTLGNLNQKICSLKCTKHPTNFYSYDQATPNMTNPNITLANTLITPIPTRGTVTMQGTPVQTVAILPTTCISPYLMPTSHYADRSLMPLV